MPIVDLIIKITENMVNWCIILVFCSALFIHNFIAKYFRNDNYFILAILILPILKVAMRLAYDLCIRFKQSCTIFLVKKMKSPGDVDLYITVMYTYY